MRPEDLARLLPKSCTPEEREALLDPSGERAADLLGAIYTPEELAAAVAHAEMGRVVVGLEDATVSRSERTLLELGKAVELGCLLTTRRTPTGYTASVYSGLGESKGMGETPTEALEVAIEGFWERWEASKRASGASVDSHVVDTQPPIYFCRAVGCEGYEYPASRQAHPCGSIPVWSEPGIEDL